MSTATPTTSIRQLREGKIAKWFRIIIGLWALIMPFTYPGPPMGDKVMMALLGLVWYQLIATMLIWICKLLAYGGQRVLRRAMGQRERARYIAPLDERHYGILFYCLDILDCEGNILTADMAAKVREVRDRISKNLFHEDPDMWYSAEMFATADLSVHQEVNSRYRREGNIRFEALMKVAEAYDELVKEIEEYSKANDWERARQAVTDRRDRTMRAAVLAALP